jgi:hypothetical protein
MNFGKLGIAALAASVLAATPALAEHHSNTLHKIGSALQYGVRKDASNLSIDTHRALGKKSVEHRRYGRYRRNVVITPKGHVKPAYHHAVVKRVYRHGTVMHVYHPGHVSRYHHKLPHSR